MEPLMKAFGILALLFASSITALPAAADTYVSGYSRANGTYVAPHYRSDADSSFNNNWSTQGNTNPYTGQAGTKTPSYGVDTSSYGNTTSYGGYKSYSAPSYGSGYNSSSYGQR